MKKILSFILLAFFSLSTFGLQVSVHHCKGKDSYSIFGFDINKHCKCSHTASGHKPKCCNNETFTFQSNDDPFTSSNKTIAFQQFSIEKYLSAKEFQLVSLPQQHTSFSIIAHAPPEKNIQRSSLFCIFRI